MLSGKALADESGAALLEMAVVSPFILALFAALIDFGFQFKEHQVLVEATRVAARTAALIPSGQAASVVSSGALNAAVSHLQGQGLSSDDYVIEIRSGEILVPNAGTLSRIVVGIERREPTIYAFFSAHFVGGVRVESSFVLPDGNTAENLSL